MSFFLFSSAFPAHATRRKSLLEHFFDCRTFFWTFPATFSAWPSATKLGLLAIWPACSLSVPLTSCTAPSTRSFVVLFHGACLSSASGLRAVAGIRTLHFCIKHIEGRRALREARNRLAPTFPVLRCTFPGGAEFSICLILVEAGRPRENSDARADEGAGDRCRRYARQTSGNRLPHPGEDTLRT